LGPPGRKNRDRSARLPAVLAGSLMPLWMLAGSGFAQSPPRLMLPVDCEIGTACFVQNHVDVDPGPGVLDHRCGARTYDGHTGVDFRLLSAAAARQGVAVRAAAAGLVKSVREGMVDRLIEADDKAAVAGRECGNGVVIDHGDGWETQYCHLRQGSLRVRQGDRVEQGATLGQVGYSGLAAFAHVHLTVRRASVVVDPFTGEPIAARCALEPAAAPNALWDDAAGRALAYRAGEIIGAGIAGAPVVHARLERDHADFEPLQPASPALIVFIRIMNAAAGDRLRLELDGPAGIEVRQRTAPLDRAKATFTAFAGRKLTGERWPAGEYSGSVAIERDGVAIVRRPVRARL
jgi:murein DD-endopeptidase MepM/ murein hydrolase activator NlpD